MVAGKIYHLILNEGANRPVDVFDYVHSTGGREGPYVIFLSNVTSDWSDAALDPLVAQSPQFIARIILGAYDGMAFLVWSANSDAGGSVTLGSES